jgi:predicted amidohydrolase
MIFGIDETRGGKLFNTAVLMNLQGPIVGTPRKVHLQYWMSALGVNRGDGFPVWEVRIGRVKTRMGIEICYDTGGSVSSLNP